jgi:hypothetical protein
MLALGREPFYSVMKGGSCMFLKRNLPLMLLHANTYVLIKHPIRHSTTVEDSLQIRLFMQNKPNFRKSQMNVNKVLTKDYEQMDTWSSGKNKPKQSQFQIKCAMDIIDYSIFTLTRLAEDGQSEGLLSPNLKKCSLRKLFRMKVLQTS